MARVKLTPETAREEEAASSLARIEEAFGMVPNSTLLMQYLPGLYEGLSQAMAAVLSPKHAPAGLLWMVGHVASRAAGCRYCWAHSGTYTAAKGGVDPEKIEHIWEFETSPLFSNAERAALRVAAAAGVSPNATTDEMFEDLHKYFDDRAIVQLVAMMSLYGFMNRWNDTLAPPLEPAPRQFAERYLKAGGWSIGRHG